MFRIFQDRKNQALATEFLSMLAYRVDHGYKLFLQRTLQSLLDAGVEDAPLKKLAASDHSKFYYFVGVACEGMRASSNLLGPNAGQKLNTEIVAQLAGSGLPFGKKKSLNIIRLIADDFEANPTETRAILVLHMLDHQGFLARGIHEKVENGPLVRLRINSTLMEDGTGGIMKELLVKRGIIAR